MKVETLSLHKPTKIGFRATTIECRFAADTNMPDQGGANQIKTQMIYIMKPAILAVRTGLKKTCMSMTLAAALAVIPKLALTQTEDEYFLNTAIASGVGEAHNDSLSFYFVVGEIVANWNESDGVIFTSGISGGVISVTPTDMDDPGERPMGIIAFPNPMLDRVHMNLGELLASGWWEAEMFNSNGMLIYRSDASEHIESKILTISMEAYEAGTYLLSVSTSKHKKPATFRVVKVQ